MKKLLLLFTSTVLVITLVFYACQKEEKDSLQDLLREYPGLKVENTTEKLPILRVHDLAALRELMEEVKSTHKVNYLKTKAVASRVATGTHVDSEHTLMTSLPPFGTTISIEVNYDYCTKYNSFLKCNKIYSYGSGMSMLGASWTQIGGSESSILTPSSIEYTFKGIGKWQINLVVPIPILGNTLTFTNVYEVHGIVLSSYIPTEADGDPCVAGDTPDTGNTNGGGSSPQQPWFTPQGGGLPHDVPEDPGITIIIIMPTIQQEQPITDPGDVVSG